MLWLASLRVPFKPKSDLPHRLPRMPDRLRHSSKYGIELEELTGKMSDLQAPEMLPNAATPLNKF